MGVVVVLQRLPIKASGVGVFIFCEPDYRGAQEAQFREA